MMEYVALVLINNVLELGYFYQEDRLCYSYFNGCGFYYISRHITLETCLKNSSKFLGYSVVTDIKCMNKHLMAQELLK